MRFYTLIILSLVRLSVWASSSNLRNSSDPVAAAMGDIVHCSAHFRNPAVATDTNQYSLYIDYHNDYEVKELSTYEASLLLPSDWAEHLVRLRHFGFKNYQHNTLEYGLGKRLSTHWSIGSNLRLQWLELASEEQTIHLYGDLGAQLRLTRHITLALLAKNIAGATLASFETFGNDGVWEDFSIIGAASAQFLTNARWCVEVESIALDEWEVRNGFEFRHERLALRCGFRMLPIIPTLGCGFDLKWLTIDCSTHYHNQLGYSFAFGIGHKF